MATLGIHQIAVWSPDIRKTPLCCDCNRDRAALARRSDARPLWAQLRFHYDLCVSTTLIARPHGAQDTRSVRPSPTLQRCNYNIGDRTTLLERSRCVCCVHTYGVRTTILRRPSAFCCVFGPILWQARMLRTHFLKCKYEILYHENELWFHSSLNQ